MAATAAQGEVGGGDGLASNSAGAASMAAATAFAGAGWHWHWHWHPIVRRDQRQRRRCAGVEVEVAAAETAAVPEMIRGRADRPKLHVDVDSCGCWEASGDACDCGPYRRQREQKTADKHASKTGCS